MTRLTPAMAADLARCVDCCARTQGTYDHPKGRAIVLRTGPALERRGMVLWANKTSVNRSKRWLPTDAGRDYYMALMNDAR